MILAIETSCDETAAALLDGSGRLRANVVSSQAELHARFGGRRHYIDDHEDALIMWKDA